MYREVGRLIAGDMRLSVETSVGDDVMLVLDGTTSRILGSAGNLQGWLQGILVRWTARQQATGMSQGGFVISLLVLTGHIFAAMDASFSKAVSA